MIYILLAFVTISSAPNTAVVRPIAQFSSYEQCVQAANLRVTTARTTGSKMSFSCLALEMK